MSPRSIILVASLVAGCNVITPYRMEIQQGNVVTREMVAKLQPGMTRSQVRFALGTPMVVDPFRTDRWDYIYSFEKGGKVTEQRHIVVIFQNDKFLRIEGDVAPGGGATPGGVKIDPPAAAAGGAQAEKK